MTQVAPHQITTPVPGCALYVALELSKSTWKLGFAVDRSGAIRVRDVEARDLERFLAEVEEAKTRFGLASDAPVRSCYEAGRDGFWIHRFLEAHEIENIVIDAASIEVNRRARRRKTDKIDVHKLVRECMRYHEGDGVVAVVRVPSEEVEDERRLPRQLKRLKKDRTRVSNSIRGALFREGIDLDPRGRRFDEELDAARQWNAEPLLAGVRREVGMLREQLELIDRQIKDLERQQRKTLEDVRHGRVEGTSVARVAALLTLLRGVGDTGAYLLAAEFFGWRKFANRREVGALAGLTGTPFASGETDRDQGISKAGNPWVRTLMVELAWCWLHHQPTSKLTRWFRERVGKEGSRNKRKAIVAMARKLLVQLWQFVEHGVVPDGAVLSADPRPAASAA